MTARRAFLKAEGGGDRAPAVLPFDVRLLVARGLPRPVAEEAVDLAARHGSSPGQALLEYGFVDAETYYRCLAAELGVEFAGPETVVPDPRPRGLADVEPARLSFLALAHEGAEMRLAVAPPPATIERVVVHLLRHPEIRRRVSIATPATMEGVRQCQHAVRLLLETRPTESASFLMTGRQRWCLAALAASAGALCWWQPMASLVVWLGSTGVLFIAASAVRSMAAVSMGRRTMSAPVPRLPVGGYPSYSVLVPLYREAGVVADLVAALRRLDYPRDRLQILLIAEADDRETRDALEAAMLEPPFEICIVPPFGPRTKPKALSFGLRFARGELVAVYDAEDRPNRDQLRRAAEIFASGPPDLGCVQASLAIDHAGESFFTRHLALEYALQFDVLMPWLGRLGLPVRLGGTSNHIRRRALQDCGGWDPHNVTEDLDLGVRMLREGWQLGCLDSTTWEEAPLSAAAWCSQRIRWHKGWLQSWFVHMRQPVRFFRELGPAKAGVVLAMFAGTVLALVTHPAFLVLLGVYALDHGWWPRGGGIAADAVMAVGLSCLLLGNGGLLYAYGRAAARRGLRFGWREWLGLPLYWLLMSAVLVVAVVELVRKPSHWRKTAHGLARSRPAAEHPPGSVDDGDLRAGDLRARNFPEEDWSG